MLEENKRRGFLAEYKYRLAICQDKELSNQIERGFQLELGKIQEKSKFSQTKKSLLDYKILEKNPKVHSKSRPFNIRC